MGNVTKRRPLPPNPAIMPPDITRLQACKIIAILKRAQAKACMAKVRRLFDLTPFLNFTPILDHPEPVTAELSHLSCPAVVELSQLPNWIVRKIEPIRLQARARPKVTWVIGYSIEWQTRSDDPSEATWDRVECTLNPNVQSGVDKMNQDIRNDTFFRCIEELAQEWIPYLESIGPALPGDPDAQPRSAKNIDKPGKRRGPKPATKPERAADAAAVREWQDHCKKEADENGNLKPDREAWAKSKSMRLNQFKAIQDRVRARKKRDWGTHLN